MSFCCLRSLLSIWLSVMEGPLQRPAAIDSHTLHPTGQSVSMRGLGRGRTLVLTDGVPLNDPFGGWIHWNKVPLNEIVRAEIVRGATSNLYGSLAMAGVIQYLTAPTYEKRLFAQVDGGNLNSYHGNFTTAGPLGENFSGAVLHGDFYRTDGYPIVQDRGPVSKTGLFRIQQRRPQTDLETILSTHCVHGG